MVIIVFILLYVGNLIYTLGTSLKTEYKETKYPIVNLTDDANIITKIKNLYTNSNCSGLLELYKKSDRDKVVRMKFNKKEAYYYARYIGVKGYIYKKITELYKRSKCKFSGLDNEIFRNTSNPDFLRKKVTEYIESAKLNEAFDLTTGYKELRQINKLITSIKSTKYKNKTENNKKEKLEFEHTGTIQLRKCSEKKSFIPKYGESEFFINMPDSVVFFEDGNMYIYDTQNYLNEVLSLYDNIKIDTETQNYLNPKNILGVEKSGRILYLTVFSGNFFSGKTLERLGINASIDHIFNIPIYKISAFDLYNKKIIWESTLSDNFSYLSPPTIVGKNLYAICGEFTQRELSNYLCKLSRENGKVIDKIYLSTDEISAIARDKKTMFYIEYSKPYVKGDSIYLLLNSGGIVARYDFHKNFISFIIRFRHNDILPLPLRFYGEQIWVGKKTMVFFNSNHYNFFIVDKNTAKLINTFSRAILENNIKKCYGLDENYICITPKNLIIFNDNTFKIINFKVDDIFINDGEVFIIKNETMYFAKKLFFSKIYPVFKLNKGLYVEQLAYRVRFLFLKGLNNKNCSVNIFERK